VTQAASDRVDAYASGETAGGGEVVQVMEPDICDTNFVAGMDEGLGGFGRHGANLGIRKDKCFGWELAPHTSSPLLTAAALRFEAAKSKRVDPWCYCPPGLIFVVKGTRGNR
jgi:hypothetical protein